LVKRNREKKRKDTTKGCIEAKKKAQKTWRGSRDGTFKTEKEKGGGARKRAHRAPGEIMLRCQRGEGRRKRKRNQLRLLLDETKGKNQRKLTGRKKRDTKALRRNERYWV